MTFEHTKKILLYLAILAGFIMTLSIISQTFDGDFGWHLRFGKEVWSGQFPYTDTYTYPYFGKAWVNHEWGGDVLFWKMYATFGYTSLVLLMSMVLWGAFIVIYKTFNVRLTIGAVLISILNIWSVQHIMVVRLAMFTPLFLALLLYTLERMPQKKLYYFWPPLLWLWSALHGSWILGIIVIAIYFGAQVVEHFIQLVRPSPSLRGSSGGLPSRAHACDQRALAHGCPEDGNPSSPPLSKGREPLWQPNPWPMRILLEALLALVISLAIILINPYGFGIYEEVAHYFSFNFYKAHITEWVPSYTFPIYWHSLLLSGIALGLCIAAAQKKRFTLAQGLLFISFFISAIQYKRNMLLFMLLCGPLFAACAQDAWEQMKKIKIFQSFFVQKMSTLYTGALIIFIGLSYGVNIHITRDVWKDEPLLTLNGMPYKATAFLQNSTAGTPSYIFNYFSWGGYLNWQIQNAQIYFDGRGTATWMYNASETMLQHYYTVMFQPNGLREIEKSPATYILVRNPRFAVLPKPDWFNAHFFSADDLNKVFTTAPSQLINDLTTSTAWAMVYKDAMAQVWKKL